MNEVYIQLKKLRTLNKKSDLNNRDNFGHLKYKNLISSKFKLKNLIKTKTNEILQMYLNVTFSSANNENSIGKKFKFYQLSMQVYNIHTNTILGKPIGKPINPSNNPEILQCC